MLINGKEHKDWSSQIGDFLKLYTIPLFKDLECEDDFIELYEKNDKRIKMGDKEHICVAGAYVLRKDYAKGLNVLESRFKARGRKRYASVFRYIENLL